MAQRLLGFRQWHWQERGERVVSTATGKRLLMLATVMLLVSACGGGTDTGASVSTPTAASLGPQVSGSVAEFLAEPRYASASPELGDRVLFQCTACHTLNEGGAHRLGPNLYGIFGRKAGTIEGFGYTRAMQDAAFIWTPEAMDAWLVQPAYFLPGNAMAFAGIRNQEDRDALVASLLRRTQVEGQ